MQGFAGYRLPTWKDPHRKRLRNASYKDPRYCLYYDLDNNDFAELATKIRNGIRLSESENIRYGNHIYTLILNVLGNKRWKNKPREEQGMLFEKAVMDLLVALPKFDICTGKKIYSYGFQCCVNSFLQFYKKEKREKKKTEKIQDHLDYCFEDYLKEISSGKVDTTEY